MKTTSGPFSERIQHSKVFRSRYFSNSDHKPWTCSKDYLIADLSDHVFTGGCRLMYRPISWSTVDWHIGRYVCRDSVEYRPICRSWVGRYICRVVFPVGRDSIGSVSTMYRWIVGRVSVRYRWYIGIEKMTQHSSSLLGYEAAGQNWFSLFWPLNLQSWND